MARRKRNPQKHTDWNWEDTPVPDILMPENWNDVEGWENYYKAMQDADNRPDYGSFSPDGLPAFVTQLLNQNWKTAWLPGCGMSPLPKLLAYLGLDVHATDISPTAVAYQESEDNTVTLPNSTEKPFHKGSFTSVVQDFRQPYLENYFDIIFNVKAFQGFSQETMCQVAEGHYQALKPGRHAYFDTMNVQGERRDILEESLAEAGFVLPFYKLTLWYRQRLRETNIPHVFILGRPMVPMDDVYEKDKARWERDRATLNGIAQEYERKAQDEQEHEEPRQTEEDRTAIVIYSTG